ncbi:MAG: hypothetical protein HC836_32845 [Richelia sp. RM2_1_2]|nr:hypothetical protein [Richelia sp. RM2_1_2]
MPSLSGILRQLPIRDLFSDDVVRDSHRAAKIYDRQGTPVYPALQNQFFANFTINVGTGFALNSIVGFRIKSFSRPSVNYEVQEINQYNKKRLVQTGVKYGPSQIVFYDTNDLMIHQLFLDYNAHYYGDFSTLKTSGSWIPDQVSDGFVTDSRGWGFSPSPNQIPPLQYFFDKIDLYDVAPDGSYTQWQLIHPVVESWNLGEDTYEGGQIQKEIQMNFRFEGIAPLIGLGPAGGRRLDEQFSISAFSDHAELPSELRSLLTDAGSITRDIFGGSLGNIAARFGLPIGSLLTAIQTGNINPVAVGSDVIRTVNGSSALGSFGDFIFGDSSSSSTASGSSGGFSLGELATSILGRNLEITEQIVDPSQTTNTNQTTSTKFYEPQVTTTQQTFSSTSGQISVDLSTAVSGTLPGVVNPSGTTLSKNYVNEAVAVGAPLPRSGVDTNTFQVAQSLAQSSSKLSPEYRDAIAGALVNAAKKTGQPLTDLAAKKSQELSLSTTAIRELNKIKPVSAQHGIRNSNKFNINDPDLRRLVAAKRK